MLEDIYINEIYVARYLKFVRAQRSISSKGYTEKHHIIPKCLGGSDESYNIVKLSARAHFIAHKMLCKAYPKNAKLKHALAMMGTQSVRRNLKSRHYEEAKLARSIAMSGKNHWTYRLSTPHPLSGVNNPMYGKKHRTDSLQKMSKSIIVEGKTYISQREAVRKTGISRGKISRMLKDGRASYVN